MVSASCVVPSGNKLRFNCSSNAVPARGALEAGARAIFAFSCCLVLRPPSHRITMSRGRESPKPSMFRRARDFFSLQRRSSSAHTSSSMSPTSASTSSPRRATSQTPLQRSNLTSQPLTPDLTPTSFPTLGSQPPSHSSAHQSTEPVEASSDDPSVGFAAFKTALSFVKEVSDPIPVFGSPLSAAVGGLLAIIEQVEVCQYVVLFKHLLTRESSERATCKSNSAQPQKGSSNCSQCLRSICLSRPKIRMRCRNVRVTSSGWSPYAHIYIIMRLNWCMQPHEPAM